MSLAATGSQLAWHDPGATEENKCCCAPPGCCLYPWPNPDGDAPLYPGTDLPVELQVSKDGGATWVTVTLDASTYSYTSEDGFYSIDASTLENWRVVYFEEGVQYSEGFSGCLVGSYTDFGVDPAAFMVRDVFPDTLTVLATLVFPETEMFRVSRCFWESANWGGWIPGTPCNGLAVGQARSRLFYAEASRDFALETVFVDVFENCRTSLDIKDSPQNSPVGTYNPGGWTVE